MRENTNTNQSSFWPKYHEVDLMRYINDATADMMNNIGRIRNEKFDPYSSDCN